MIGLPRISCSCSYAYGPLGVIYRSRRDPECPSHGDGSEHWARLTAHARELYRDTEAVDG